MLAAFRLVTFARVPYRYYLDRGRQAFLRHRMEISSTFLADASSELASFVHSSLFIRLVFFWLSITLLYAEKFIRYVQIVQAVDDECSDKPTRKTASQPSDPPTESTTVDDDGVVFQYRRFAARRLLCAQRDNIQPIFSGIQHLAAQSSRGKWEKHKQKHTFAHSVESSDLHLMKKEYFKYS